MAGHPVSPGTPATRPRSPGAIEHHPTGTSAPHRRSTPTRSRPGPCRRQRAGAGHSWSRPRARQRGIHGRQGQQSPPGCSRRGRRPVQRRPRGAGPSRAPCNGPGDPPSTRRAIDLHRGHSGPEPSHPRHGPRRSVRGARPREPWRRRGWSSPRWERHRRGSAGATCRPVNRRVELRRSTTSSKRGPRTLGGVVCRSASARLLPDVRPARRQVRTAVWLVRSAVRCAAVTSGQTRAAPNEWPGTGPRIDRGGRGS